MVHFEGKIGWENGDLHEVELLFFEETLESSRLVSLLGIHGRHFPWSIFLPSVLFPFPHIAFRSLRQFAFFSSFHSCLHHPHRI